MTNSQLKAIMGDAGANIALVLEGGTQIEGDTYTADFAKSLITVVKNGASTVVDTDAVQAIALGAA